VLRLDAGITAADIELKPVYSSYWTWAADLEVKIKGTTDKITFGGGWRGVTGGTDYATLQRIEFADGTVWDLDAMKSAVLAGTPGADSISGTAGDDIINGQAGADTVNGSGGNDTLDGGTEADSLYGGDGNDSLLGRTGDDKLYGEAGQDTLLGHEGNDTLDGGVGNDVLDGGLGNDQLSGGTGNNTYVFARGSGQDTVANQLDNTVGKINVLRLDAGIAPADIELKAVYSSYWTWAADLEVKIKGTTDKITFGGGWRGVTGSNDYATLQRIEFADGTVWDLEAMKAAVFAGTSGADSISGTSGDDLINGQAGVDTLSGGGGNDTLDGGTGNDQLTGGTGGDTYQFGRGYGADHVVENDTTAGVEDKVRFGAGIAKSDVSASRSGNHLVVAIAGTSDTLTIDNWYAGSKYQVEKFLWADGSVSTAAEMEALAGGGVSAQQTAMSVSSVDETTDGGSASVGHASSLLSSAAVRWALLDWVARRWGEAPLSPMLGGEHIADWATGLASTGLLAAEPADSPRRHALRGLQNAGRVDPDRRTHDLIQTSLL
jgi:Ca2+-binding RTX toxin-like protein